MLKGNPDNYGAEDADMPVYVDPSWYCTCQLPTFEIDAMPFDADWHRVCYLQLLLLREIPSSLPQIVFPEHCLSTHLLIKAIFQFSLHLRLLLSLLSYRFQDWRIGKNFKKYLTLNSGLKLIKIMKIIYTKFSIGPWIENCLELWKIFVGAIWLKQIKIGNSI